MSQQRPEDFSAEAREHVTVVGREAAGWDSLNPDEREALLAAYAAFDHARSSGDGAPEERVRGGKIANVGDDTKEKR